MLVINALGGKREAVDQMGGRLIRFRRARTVGLESMGLFGAWERERERERERHMEALADARDGPQDSIGYLTLSSLC